MAVERKIEKCAGKGLPGSIVERFAGLFQEPTDGTDALFEILVPNSCDIETVDLFTDRFELLADQGCLLGIHLVKKKEAHTIPCFKICQPKKL